MTTTIDPNTFKGPNQGNANGYIPQTIIESAKVDADMLQILADLDNHLSLFQTAFTKLDQINLDELGQMTAEEIVTTINVSNQLIDADNLALDVVTTPDLDAAIEEHRVNTTFTKMHPETSIRSTELPYSSTPTTLITSCANILDEIKNLRYQIKRLNGKTYWSDTPAASLSSLSTALNADISNLTSHIANMTLHITACQNAALDNANCPCGANPFATMNDISTKGGGDMLRSVYDKDKDGIVDLAEGLYDGCINDGVTYTEIKSKIASNIAAHRAIASAHHTRYTNAEAICAINTDADHSSTAKHYYSDLIGKPRCSELTDSEVDNIKASKLANGLEPWSNVLTLDSSGLLPPSKLPIEVISNTWSEDNNTVANAYFSATVAGEVSATFTGPCLIYNGFGTITQHSSYLQYSVDNGSTWKYCSVSPLMMRGPSSAEDDLYTWVCPFIYIPIGYSYKIRAGSTYTGSSVQTYGAGFNIRYKQF